MSSCHGRRGPTSFGSRAMGSCLGPTRKAGGRRHAGPRDQRADIATGDGTELRKEKKNAKAQGRKGRNGGSEGHAGAHALLERLAVQELGRREVLDGDALGLEHRDLLGEAAAELLPDEKLSALGADVPGAPGAP